MRGRLGPVYQALSDHYTQMLQRLYPVWALVGPGLADPAQIEIDPADTQRVFELRLAPQLQWTIRGRVDLDTVRVQRVFVDCDGQAYAIQDTGEPLPTITMAYADAPADLREPVKIGRSTHQPSAAIDLHKAAVEHYEQALARIQEHGLQAGEKAPRAPRELPGVEVPVDRLARFGDVSMRP